MKKLLLLSAIYYLLSTPVAVRAIESTIPTPVSTLTLTSQDIYSVNETPAIKIDSHSTLLQKIRDFFGGSDNDPHLLLRDPSGDTIIDSRLSSSTTITPTSADLNPGEYTILIDDHPVGNFSWGVLVLNLDKGRYLPGDTAFIQIASLSSTGHTLCHSNLRLTINDQVIPLQNSETCGADNVTDSPDYFAHYSLSNLGTYPLTLTNLDTGLTINDSITVVDTRPYTIARVGATRINPFKSDYTMTLKVSSTTSWSGLIKEQLPPSFEALTPISWQVDLTAGEPTTLTYKYRAPKLSPAIFPLGPLSVGDYHESRQWSLASDATFQMQTGYYVGDGADSRAITGVGFQPQLIFIKDDTAGGTDGVIWKSSAMSGEVSSKLGENEADLATDAIQSLDSNGFTLGTDDDVNGANVRFTWVAFAGSDCTSSGTFCVNSYTGDGNASQAITTVGFQPDLVTIKTTGADYGIFRTSSMGTNVTQIFRAANESTDGSRVKTLDATGFTVGNNAQVNTASTTYWYFAFKTTTNAFAVGTYTGDGADNRALTAVGFQPNYLWVKNSNATAAAPAKFSLTESNGDYTGYFSDAVNAVDMIQSLDSSGFTVGTDASINESGKTLYWVAFGGAPSYSSSGIYKMATGSYSGNGTSQSVSSLGFTPNLVIIKHNDQATDQYAVFRTSLMKGNSTNYFALNAAAFTGGITTIDSDGFSVGADPTVNTSGDTYYWSAFGNAWNPETGSGAVDFSIGAYTGNGIDDHNILRLPWQPSLLAIKRDTGSSGGFRTSEMTGDTTGYYTATAETSDWIQSISANSFQVGTAAQVNSAVLNHFFAFKTGNAFTVGSYTGNGTSQNITAPAFQPNLIWVKKATGGTAREGILRTSAQSGDAAQPFLNSPTTTTDITGILSTGFSVGAGNLANENTFTYRYAAWMINVAPATPSLDSPSDTATGVSLTPALLTTTTDTSSDYLRYKIQLCENAGMSTNCQTFDQTSSQTGWSGQNTQTSTAYTSGTQATYTIQSALAGLTTYYWRSYAIDPGGTDTWSGTQTPRSFTTISSNSAPNTPSLDSPADSATNQSLTPPLLTTTTDTESDYLRYKIQVCENVGMSTNCQTFDQTSSQTGWSGQNTETSTAYTSGTQATYTIQSALSAATTYYWRSYAIDPGGSNTWSGTQTPYSFTTSTAPGSPTTPYAEGVGNPTGIIDLTPEFSAIHNDANADAAVYYQINVNTASDFTGTSMWDSGTVSMTSTADTVRSPDISYAGTALTYNGTTYYWRIRFKDTKGAVGAWSATQNFSTNSVSSTPSLDSPADTATGQSLTPALLTTATDTNSDYLRYKIELCENVGMSTNCQTFDETSSQTGWSGQNTETSTAYTSGTQATYTIQTPLANSFTYYWRSYAIDPGGSNTWSGTQTPYSFTTLEGPPSEVIYLDGINLEGINFN